MADAAPAPAAARGVKRTAIVEEEGSYDRENDVYIPPMHLPAEAKARDDDGYDTHSRGSSRSQPAYNDDAERKRMHYEDPVIRALRSQLEQLEAKLSLRNTDLDRLQQQFSTQVAAHAVAMANKEREHAEAAADQGDVEGLRAKIKELEDTVGARDRSIEVLQRSHAGEISKCSEVMTKSRAEVTKWADAASASGAKVELMRTELAKAVGNRDLLAHEVESIRAHSVEEIRKLKKDHDAKIKRAEGIVEEHIARIQTLNKEKERLLKTKVGDVLSKFAKNIGWTEPVKDMDKGVKERFAQLVKLHKSHDNLLACAIESEKKAAADAATIKKLKGELHDARATDHAMLRELESSQLLNDIKELKTKHKKELADVRMHTDTAIQHKDAEIATLKEESDALEARVKKLTTKYEKSKTRTADVTKARTDDANAAADAITELRAQLDAANKRISILTKDGEALMSQGRTDLENMKSLEEELGKAKGTIQSYTAANEILTKRLASAKALADAGADSSEACKRLTDENTVLKSRVTALEAHRVSQDNLIKNLVAKNTAMHKDNKASNSDLNSEIVERGNIIQKLNETLDAVTAEAKQLRAENERLAKEPPQAVSAAVREEYKRLEMQAAALRATVAERDAEIDNLIEAARATAEDDESNAAIAALQCETDSLKRDIDRLQSMFSLAIGEVDTAIKDVERRDGLLSAFIASRLKILGREMLRISNSGTDGSHGCIVMSDHEDEDDGAAAAASAAPVEEPVPGALKFLGKDVEITPGSVVCIGDRLLAEGDGIPPGTTEGAFYKHLVLAITKPNGKNKYHSLTYRLWNLAAPIKKAAVNADLSEKTRYVPGERVEPGVWALLSQAPADAQITKENHTIILPDL